MFIYLAHRGRHWLQLTGALLVVMIGMASLAPAASAAVNKFAKGPGPAWKPSKVADSALTPWFGKNDPWDGGWQPFNSTINESLQSACPLDSKASSSLSSLKAGLYADWSHIKDQAGKHKSGYTTPAQQAKKFRASFKERLQGNEGTEGQKGHKINDGGKKSMSQLFPGGYVNGLKSYDQFTSDLAQSDALQKCETLGQMGDEFMKNYGIQPALIFKDPLRFVLAMVLWPFAIASSSLFTLTSPYGLGLLLNTPHSERGDTMFDSFSVAKQQGFADTATGKLAPVNSAGNQKGNKIDFNKGSGSKCKSGLGFVCPKDQGKGDKAPAWIKIANSLRSVLSAIYGVIVIVVACAYMYRKSARTQLDLKVAMPRLFLAVMMSAMAPYLIGAAITISNWMLMALFSYDGRSVPAQLYRSVLTMGQTSWADTALGGAVGQMANMLIPVFLLMTFSIVMLAFVIIAIIKQLALIGLIVATPVACLAIVFRDSGSSLVKKWWKSLVAVIYMPVAMGAVIYMGIILCNSFFQPLDQGGASSSGLGDTIQRYIGVLMVAGGMLMSLKVGNSMIKWATGKGLGSAAGAATSAAGKVGGMAAGAAVTATTGSVTAGKATAGAVQGAGNALGAKMAGKPSGGLASSVAGGAAGGAAGGTAGPLAGKAMTTADGKKFSLTDGGEGAAAGGLAGTLKSGWGETKDALRGHSIDKDGNKVPLPKKGDPGYTPSLAAGVGALARDPRGALSKAGDAVSGVKNKAVQAASNVKERGFKGNIAAAGKAAGRGLKAAGSGLKAAAPTAGKLALAGAAGGGLGLAAYGGYKAVKGIKSHSKSRANAVAVARGNAIESSGEAHEMNRQHDQEKRNEMKQKARVEAEAEIMKEELKQEALDEARSKQSSGEKSTIITPGDPDFHT